MGYKRFTTDAPFSREFFHIINVRIMDAKQLIDANIVDLLGLNNLPEQRKTELLTRMTEVIQDRISDRVMDALSADDRTAFEQLLERNAKEEDINSFLQSHVPGFEQFLAEEVLRFKQQMVNDVAVVRKIAAA